MKTKRYLLAVLSTFVALFAIDFITHGVLLMGLYEETAQLWRPQEDYRMPFMLISQLTFTAVFVCLFTRNYEGKGMGEGLRFGFYIGLLFATMNIGMYSYMPLPLALVGAWIVASIVKGLIMGAVTSLVYKK
jgi:hypothetical protein